MLRLITSNDTYTLCRAHSDEGSALRIDLYLTTHNTQQQTDIHAPSGIRTRSSGKRAAVDSRLRPRFHWVRPLTGLKIHNSSCKYLSLQCHHMSLMDYVVSPPGCGRSVTDFWGWDAREAQLRCPDEVDGDIWIWSTRRGLKPKL
jgi:hypothetical protein